MVKRNSTERVLSLRSYSLHYLFALLLPNHLLSNFSSPQHNEQNSNPVLAKLPQVSPIVGHLHLGF